MGVYFLQKTQDIVVNYPPISTDSNYNNYSGGNNHEKIYRKHRILSVDSDLFGGFGNIRFWFLRNTEIPGCFGINGT